MKFKTLVLAAMLTVPTVALAGIGESFVGNGALYALGSAIEPLNPKLGVELKNVAILKLVLTDKQEADIIAATTDDKTYQLWLEYKEEFNKNHN